MSRGLSRLLDRVEEWRRESVFGRRRSSPSVPFVPNPPPSGWIDLEEDIAAEFGSLEIDYEEARVRDFVRQSLGDDFDGSSFRSMIRASHAWRDHAKLAGRCVWCGDPRGKDGTADYCATHRRAKNDAQRRRSSRLRSEGRCTSCTRPVDKSAQCGLCEECYRDLKGRVCNSAQRRRDAARRAGNCYRCPARNPKKAILAGRCEEHHALDLARLKTRGARNRACDVRRRGCNCRPSGGRPGPCLVTCASKAAS